MMYHQLTMHSQSVTGRHVDKVNGSLELSLFATTSLVRKSMDLHTIDLCRGRPEIHAERRAGYYAPKETLQHVDVAFECLLGPNVVNTGEVKTSADYMNVLDGTGDLPPVEWEKYVIRASVHGRPRRMSDHATRRRVIRVSSSP
jgi:hypothetical protein